MQRETGGTAVFASYNIHKCVGVDRRFDPGRIVRVMAELGADVLAVQEADRRFGEREALLDLADVEREAGLVPVRVDNGHKGHGWHGNLVFVREGAVRDLTLVRLPGLEPRGALVIDVDLAIGPVRIVAVHLGLLRQSRLQQIEALMTHAGAATEHPVVIMGDMNEWRVRRRSSLRHVHPSFGPLGLGVPSFPAYFPVLALDRILARPHGIIESFGTHASALSRIASDHLPVRAVIRLGASAGAAPAQHPSPRRRPRLFSRLVAHDERIV